MNILQKLFDHNEREVLKYRKRAEHITSLGPDMEALSDEQLSAKTAEFRARIAEDLAAEIERRGLPWEEMDKEQRRLTSDAVLDPLLPEAFAVVREAARRVLGMRHFDVQLIGGMVTHDGRIGELKTGEGKTLMATAPLYLNALFGKGSHLVTPNDYLSKFGAVTMGPLYNFLGMTVGIIQGASPETGDGGGTFIYDPNYHDPDPRYDRARPVEKRGEAYEADITYGTNNEYGFDYLRDNIAHQISGLSQRDLFFAIVDEADSILIDEARTPLIISGPQAHSSDEYSRMDRLIRYLQPERDYTLDEKAKSASFTEEGQERMEKALNIDNLTDPENSNLMQHASAALKAHAVFQKDIDYVVKRNEQKGVDEVVIVDEFTGRLMFGRRWSDGLHQAVEAKEGVKIENESQTYATITFQNYFRLYTKLSGMTGTAKTEEEELRKVFALDVVSVPTNKTMIRLDKPDVIYKTQESKLRGITLEILRLYAKQQPVLVGTRNIEMSERVSDRLRFEPLEILSLAALLRDKIDRSKSLSKEKYAEFSTTLNMKISDLTINKLAVIAREVGIPANPRDSENVKLLMDLLDTPDENRKFLEEALDHGVPHNILNAKYHEKEAHIIAEAGRIGSVTIATNMAGRGVDIILGGTPIPQDDDEAEPEEGVLTFRRGFRDSIKMLSLNAQESDAEHREKADQVRARGGLFILGTERHESRRIDNQLRGRAGRQGDPGESRFFVSMEDELMRLFGDKSNSALLSSWSEEQSLDVPMLSKLIERAQRKVEAHNFDMRKNVLQYDDVMNTQRETIYSQRLKVLEGIDLRLTMVQYLKEVVNGELPIYASDAMPQSEWDYNGLYQALSQTFPLPYYVSSPDELKDKKFEELRSFLEDTVEHAYNDKEASVSSPIMRDIERHWTLAVLDRHWMEHLTNMEHLKEGIGWRGMAGVDPIVPYKKEAFDMFQDMLGSLQDEVIRLIFNTQVEVRQLAPPPNVFGASDMDDESGLTAIGADENADGMLDPAGEQYASSQRPPAAANPMPASSAMAAFSGQSRGTATASMRKVGRNDPCPCGSGKKYKMCHGR